MPEKRVDMSLIQITNHRASYASLDVLLQRLEPGGRREQALEPAGPIHSLACACDILNSAWELF